MFVAADSITCPAATACATVSLPLNIVRNRCGARSLCKPLPMQKAEPPADRAAAVRELFRASGAVYVTNQQRFCEEKSQRRHRPLRSIRVPENQHGQTGMA